MVDKNSIFCYNSSMKKYRVSYYCGVYRSRKYFDNIGEALRFSVHGLRYPSDLFGIDLIEE
jgi:hypothetical protein